MKKNGEIVSSYIYDPMGFRVEKVGSKGKIHYVPLQNGEVGYRKEFSANKEYSFIYVGGQHLARVNGVVGGSGKKFFYHNDHLGSAMAVTDENGNKVVERDFTPFGERINTDVYDDEPRDLDEDESGFTGKDWDEDAGLYYYNARWYDPGVGRFISQDPVGDDPTFYVYGFNNPLSYIDPSGQVGLNIVGGLMNLAAREIPGLGNVMVCVSLFRMFGTGTPNRTSPEDNLAQFSQGITASDITNLQDGVSRESTPKNDEEGWERRFKEKPLNSPVGELIAKNNNTETDSQPTIRRPTLSDMADDIQEKNKNVKVKVLSENKLHIEAKSAVNDTVNIDFLGIKLNGNEIVIEQIISYDENGIGCTNYNINNKDRIWNTIVEGESDKVKTQDGLGTVLNKTTRYATKGTFKAEDVEMRLSLTIKSNGYFSLTAEMGANNVDNIMYYSRVEISNNKVMYPSWAPQSTIGGLKYWAEGYLGNSLQQNEHAIFKMGMYLNFATDQYNVHEKTWMEIRMF